MRRSFVVAIALLCAVCASRPALAVYQNSGQQIINLVWTPYPANEIELAQWGKVPNTEIWGRVFANPGISMTVTCTFRQTATWGGFGVPSGFAQYDGTVYGYVSQGNGEARSWLEKPFLFEIRHNNGDTYWVSDTLTESVSGSPVERTSDAGVKATTASIEPYASQDVKADTYCRITIY